MKPLTVKSLFVAIAVLAGGGLAFGQGTAFTYQGRLLDGGNPANGLFDLKLRVFDADIGGSVVAGPVTNSAVVVSNGLFVTTVDFGSGVFTGPALWLHVGVRTNGAAVDFSPLTPREALNPVPYAITAENLDGTLPASQLTGTLPAGVLSGVYGGAVTLTNPADVFAGDGSGLAGLNATALTGGTVPDARLSPNVAMLNRDQVFRGTNVFSSGGGTGRLIVSNTFATVDTNLFTGLSLQYDASAGEGALMSSYNDGTGYLSFYTKPSFGLPLTKQVIVGPYGTLAIDQANQNNGLLNFNSLAGAGLTFGVFSGEGIASKRTVTGNQYGLDFYTGFQNRMSILNNGFVGIGRQWQASGAEVFGIYSPVTNTWGGMYVATGVGGRPFYGYADGTYAWTELDGTDGNKWKLYNSGYWMAVTPNGNFGLGTAAPSTSDRLDVRGSTRINDNPIYLRANGDANHGLQYRATVQNIFFDGPFLFGYNGGALGTANPDSITLKWYYDGTVWISNNCSVASLTIRGGADLAEPFQFSDASGEVPEGAVVVIDEENPGRLKLSREAYDTHVAGVVSGANGVHPGIQMQQEGMLEGGKNVALSGRVYVQADAAFGVIRPGDLLTTSTRAGYAMRVSDHGRAQGAILGKAMTGLSAGKGKVLVLVTLQ